MSRSPRGLLQQQRKLIKFDDLVDRIHRLHDQNFEDKVVDLENINVVSDGNKSRPGVFLDVPEIGKLSLTDWSKKQLGSTLGIKFDKWFDPAVISAEEIQQEIQRRFSRTHEARKVRARRFEKDAPGTKHADGYIRAFLSPTYAPIDDVRIFDRMNKRFRGHMSDVNFMQNHLGSDFFSDRSSHYTMVGEPVNMGAIDRKHSDPKVRHIYDIAEMGGALPDSDWVYQGFHFRNSEVGYTAVTIDASTFRLVCLNGMIVKVNDGRLLYRVHRSIDDDSIDSLLDGAFRKMPAAWERTRKQMQALRGHVLDDPQAEITKYLHNQKATKTFQEAVLEAFAEEPLPNRYGIMQALSRASHRETDMDKRAEIEEMAGNYMARYA